VTARTIKRTSIIPSLAHTAFSSTLRSFAWREKGKGSKSKRRKTTHMASLATSESQCTQATPRLEIIASRSEKVPDAGF
jgi:hypothetical protein